MDLPEVTAVVPAGPGSGADWRPGDAWLAGGTWLFSEPQPDVRRLVDLAAFGWTPIGEDAGGVEIAATCTLETLAAWSGRAAWPAARLAEECCRALLGSFKVWHTATVGGNLCLALPAGPMASLAVALDGECEIWGPGGSRRIAALELVTGPSRTSLAPGELLRAVRLPAVALRSATAFRSFSLTPAGRSAVVVAGRRDGDGLTVTVTASVPRPVRLRFAIPPDAVTLAAALDAAAPEFYDDVHGDPAWRAQMTRRLAEEVRAELLGDGS